MILLPVFPNGSERIIGLLIYYLWSPTGFERITGLLVSYMWSPNGFERIIGLLVYISMWSPTVLKEL